jgi:uncharacterized damage-inducible protein DinB
VGLNRFVPTGNKEETSCCAGVGFGFGTFFKDNQAMTKLHRIDDRSLLSGLLTGEGLFLEAAAVLDGLTAEQVLAKPHSLPHSIAEIVSHMCYWQEWVNSCVVTGFTAIAEHAADSWPIVPADGWDALRTRYLASIESAKQIVATSESLDESLLPRGVAIPSLARESCGSGILQVAVHNGHHLGQIVTMRQLMGLWPPPAGSMTW